MFSFLCSTREVTSVVVKETSFEDDENVDLEFQSVTCPSDLLKTRSDPKTPKSTQLKLSPTQVRKRGIFY